MMAQRLFSLVLALGIAWGGVGCASPSRAWYEGVQISAQNTCDKLPPGARDDCLSKLNQQSYDAYDKERTAPR